MAHPGSRALGGRIRSIREATGLTQLAFVGWLADRGLPITQSVLSRWETGDATPSFDALAALARLDPEGRGRLWLVWGDDPREGTVDATPSAAAPPPPPPPGPVGRLEDELTEIPPPSPPDIRRRA